MALRIMCHMLEGFAELFVGHHGHGLMRRAVF
jgi:hypothetical protein